MAVLLDSVILIDHFNGISAATSYLRNVEPTAVLSVISRAETLVGFGEDDERDRATALLNRFPCLALNQTTADVAAQLRREHGWKLPDAFQAAVAQEHDLQFATRDTRDFDPATHRFVVVPYQLSA